MDYVWSYLNCSYETRYVANTAIICAKKMCLMVVIEHRRKL